MKKLTLVMLMVFSQTSLALDFADPVVSCSKGKYLAQIGTQEQTGEQLLARLYKFRKTNVPGLGEIDYPEPQTGLLRVAEQSALMTVFVGKNFELVIWDATADMPTGDPEIDDKCEICGILKTVVDGKKKEIRGLECKTHGFSEE